MNDATILTTILLFGLVIGLAINWLVGNIITQVENIKAIMTNNKLFKSKQAAMEKMKAEGGMHEWVQVPTMQGMLLACKKTGWCPTLQGFLQLSHINSYLEAKKAEEEYKIFRDIRVGELADKHNMSFFDMEKLVEQIFSIKKDFHVERIAKLQREIEARAAAVKNGQNQV